MQKMKTKKCVSKRFHVTAFGKVKKFNQNTAHLKHNKTHKQKVHLRKGRYLNTTDGNNMKSLISK